jgi:hypothetical protein
MTNPNMPQNPNQNPVQQDNIFATAYHGIMARMAASRMNRAANIMERMDHKDALYTDIGNMALNGPNRVNAAERVELYDQAESAAATAEGRLPRVISRADVLAPGEFSAADTANGEPAMPRAFGERWLDRLIEKRGHTKEIAAIYDRRNAKIFGTNVYADLQGTTKSEKRHGKADVRAQRRQGQLTAGEARIARDTVVAERPKLGHGPVTWSNKQVRKTERAFSRSANHERLFRWRDRRRRRAIDRIQTSHAQVEKHTR